jgi:UDP-N-acetylmuramyl tripeptide synthase
MSATLDAKVIASRAVGRLARRAGRGGGTSLPGKLLTRLEPHAIARLARRLPRGTAVISATNGKTTTAAMVASVLGRSGLRLVHNRAGANMAGGVASTLLDAAGRGNVIAGDVGLFEVDEFWLDRVAPELAPRAMALSNLFRDQLDRYGELDTIADRWAGLVAALPATRLALNADDPLIADLGRDHAGVTPTCMTPSTSGTSGAIDVLSAAANAPSRRSPRRRSSSGAPGRRALICAPPRGPHRSPCRYRACTTSTTRWRRPRCACSWTPASRTS